MYAPSPGISQKLKVKPNTWYALECLAKSSSLWNIPKINIYIKPKGNLSCPVVAGDKWFPVLCFFKTPKRITKATLRASMAGLGNVCFDKISMKEIPREFAAKINEQQNTIVYPPLVKMSKLPEVVNIDFQKKLPDGVWAKGKISGDMLKNSNDYQVLTTLYFFKGNYDLRIKVRASSPDGATLGALVLQYRDSKNRMRNKRLGRVSTKLSNKLGEYDFLYRRDPDCRRAVLNFYRSNKKGTLNIRDIKLIPVRVGSAKVTGSAKKIRTTDKPLELTIEFNKKLPSGVIAAGKISDDVLESSKDYIVLTTRYFFNANYDLKLKLNASSLNGATLGVMALQYRSDRSRMKNKIIGRFRTKLTRDFKEYEFLYIHDPECREAVFVVYRSNRKGTLKIKNLKIIPVDFEKNNQKRM
jgi:hypothetical protein